MIPSEIFQQFNLKTTRLAAGRERLALASGVVAEVDLDIAINDAALSIAESLSVSPCIPSLGRALAIDTTRTKLLAAMKKQLVGDPEADLEAFKNEHRETLKNHFNLTV